MRVCKLLMVVFVVRDMAKFVCGGEMPPTKDTPPPENSTVCLLFLHKFLERKQTAQLYATIRGNHICLRHSVPQHFFCLSGLQLYLNKIQYIAAHFYIISRKLGVVFSFSRFSCWRFPLINSFTCGSLWNSQWWQLTIKRICSSTFSLTRTDPQVLERRVKDLWSSFLCRSETVAKCIFTQFIVTQGQRRVAVASDLRIFNFLLSGSITASKDCD